LAFATAVLLIAAPVLAQNTESPQPAGAANEPTAREEGTREGNGPGVSGAGNEPAGSDEAGLPDPTAADVRQRTQLNLLGRTDTSSGESRRNENVQFNLVDNNALKELNIRLGTSATIIDTFQPERRYYGAEFGNAPTAPVHLAIPAGSGVHGSVFLRHQNSVTSARSFFQVGDVQPARENSYGFQFTAPVWRGGYFLADGYQKRAQGNVNGNVLVPTPEERTPLATDPATRELVQRYLSAYPTELPNRTDINPRALNTNSLLDIRDDSINPRLEQSLGGRDKLLLRYDLVFQNVDAFQLVAGQNPDADIKSHRATVTWNRQWTASTLTDVSVGFDRLRTLLVPEENAVGTYVSTGGLTALGPAGSIPIDRALNSFRYGARIQQTRGKHVWRAGVEMLRRQLNGVETDVHRGFFSFGNDFGRDSITNLRLGTPTQHIVSIGDVHRGYRNWDFQFFAADSWRLNSRFTLQLGLGYHPVTAPYEVNGRDPIAYNCDCNNLAPQFGFAYRLSDRWGVLRGAYGLQYGQIFPVTFQQVRLAPPGNLKIVVPAANLVDPLSSYDPNDPNVLPTTYLLDEHLATPYSHQYNLSWDLELARDWNLQLGYVGSRSHKLLLMWYTNRSHPVEGIPQTSATVNLRRDVPGFAEIRRVVNGSIGYFDAARVSLIMPRRGGLSMQASYWFSKAMDLGSSYTNTGYGDDSRLSRSQSEFDQFNDMKGLSDFDQPHAFLWTASYETPALRQKGWLNEAFGNWQLASVVLLKPGTPFSVVSASDAPGFGNVDANGGDRPNLLDPSILGRTIGDPDTSAQRLPADAFYFMQPTDVRGNLGRNVFRKGGIRNVNASISRTWSLSSEKRLTFRAESINLFNTPQFAEPGTSLGLPNFGQITNTLNDGRTFQFLLRFGF
jgi:hypothetical protein